MSWLDGLVLIGAAALAGAALFTRGRALRWAWVAVVALAAVQVFREAVYWQFTPSYLLLLWAGWTAWLRRSPSGWIERGLVTVVVLAAIATWAILPSPALPRPSGPYAVGTKIHRWIDPARPEEVTDDPGDRRNVVVQAWYPAASAEGDDRLPYIDGLGDLPAQITLLPGFVFRSFGRVDTHARADAPLAPERSLWPVVILSPGYGAPRAFYSVLAADLASRGYVVLALDHPYESAVVELANGAVAKPIERFLPDDPDRLQYMEVRVVTRVGDVRFLIDQLEEGRLLPGRLDLERVAVIGHSFGGATAALALSQDPRVRAGANLDGMPYGGVERARLDRPFLVIESDHAVTRHPALYGSRVRGLLAGSRTPGARFEILGTNHYSFTDAELFFAPPARPLLRKVFGGRLPTRAALKTAADLVDGFLRDSLDGASGRLAAAAARHSDVLRAH